ncbi:hypothetical protein [Streptomyces sp. BRA346]|uniref:hypothetical protein n=1 Tax=Streptomyces sp. BRA346 TaxID=2878199 RepID=UPI0040647F32
MWGERGPPPVTSVEWHRPELVARLADRRQSMAGRLEPVDQEEPARAGTASGIPG